MERKLTTILAADVVGYSRLVSDDEEAALARLGECRALIDDLVAEHQGRVFGSAGDSVVVEFASPVEAVRCAVGIQRDLDARNADIADDKRMRWRIGVNLGDVVVDGDDLLGEGVNVAARLEELAEPGGLCISGTVHELVRNAIDVAVDDLGERALKNIAEPVRVFRVALDVTAPAADEASWSADKPSIAVLPFTNLSDDPDEAYFSDGITEDVITELSRFRSLFVIARNSSFVFRDQAVDVVEVGRKLNVQYVVEGSVRRAGERVRITAQLIDAASGAHVWAERYDRHLEDIFEVQDEVVRRIVATLPSRLEDAGAERARHKPTDSLSAYDCVLHGNQFIARMSSYEDNRHARELYRRAIALDPDYAQAHARLSAASFDAVNVWSAGEDAKRDALDFGRRAVELDGGDSWSHASLGLGLFLNQRDREAEIHMRRAVALNPNDADIAAFMAMLLICFGRPDEACEWSDKAMRLNPYCPDWYRGTLAEAAYLAGAYQRAVDALMEMAVFDFWDHRTLAAAYGQLGEAALADPEWAKFVAAWQAKRDAGEALPDDPLVYAQEPDMFRRQADRDHWLDGLRKAGVAD